MVAFLFAQPGEQDTTGMKKKTPDFKHWDVSTHYGPADTVEFTLTEGTWMNLDVSPDGKEIVFDLLGDIYVIPIEGGEARALTSGLAFDAQPRYSPDGSKISFTSDRGGGDNIWIMNRDGSEPRAVTNEDFRLLNNAVWTPDGQYLIARKHFTSRRSLGAGEMWMYHISGGKGLRLTKRKNDQQDAGEPWVSPDGRYLYFSEDMSGGSTFQYNKDPNKQIYVIRRLDLQTGKLTNYITGAGGAVRPQVSPDGQYLAFVRRIRNKSVLYLHKFETGEQWPIWDQLNKDQQETWAIFGVYPNYNWMPNSREIVIWAKGHIWRVNIHSREAKQIPFVVHARHAIARALRYKQPHVADDYFTARMLRHVVTSPDGQWLVFNAVGHLWKMKLPDGKPVRLTNDSQHFEFEPSFSPDGKWVVYTTWNDTALGAIYKVRLRGGKPQKLTERKGYYYSPRFSPDGLMVVYRRGQGNAILGFAYGVEPGIYWVAADGGQGNLIIEEGRDPYFNKAGDRIYFFTYEGEKKALKSCDLDGHDVRTHFTSQYATQIVVSPDEQWVAFQELFNVYITPYPHTGQPIELSSQSKAIPVKRVSRDAGNYIHWSG
ncbi:MAG: amidohydrolase, partial [Calditrichaeota bacterium]